MLQALLAAYFVKVARLELLPPRLHGILVRAFGESLPPTPDMRFFHFGIYLLRLLHPGFIFSFKVFFVEASHIFVGAFVELIDDVLLQSLLRCL